MKRRRPSPTPSDPEDQGLRAGHGEPGQQSASGKGIHSATVSVKEEPKATNEEPSTQENVPHTRSRARKKRRKAIPEHMRHMEGQMSVWGDRWLVAVQPSTAGSQQGEIDANGKYTALKSPPPAARRSPLLSPVVMESSSSSTAHRLSSDFTHSSYLGPTENWSSLDATFPFENPLCFDGRELFGESNAVAASSSQAFSFNAEPFSLLSDNPLPATISSTYPPSFSSSPLYNSATLMGLHPEDLISDASTDPIYPTHVLFPDWIAPPPMLPVNGVTHFTDGLSYVSPPSVSSPSANAADFLTTAWSANMHHRGPSQSMPIAGGYSNSSMSASPMYNGYESLHTLPGNPSLVSRRSVSGSPLSAYSVHSPRDLSSGYHSLSPLVTRPTTSSASAASLYSMDNHSSHSISSEIFSRSSEYGDLDYNHPSPRSLTAGSPTSVSSAPGGLELPYANARRDVPIRSRTIPLPFHNTSFIRRR
ncbi:hypothetical protein MSAN_02344800 [Mycena sanguinolenta]|uniref:Uncharacterized protein n=1 Tax=Mycena sanguinolenta TaxID=230812 RepID=A0A8H6X6B0_9AGAR|nr:hypothetical protein MSAN_02344800 [Mycena sanguinolenta]